MNFWFCCPQLVSQYLQHSSKVDECVIRNVQMASFTRKLLQVCQQAVMVVNTCVCAVGAFGIVDGIIHETGFLSWC